MSEKFDFKRLDLSFKHEQERCDKEFGKLSNSDQAEVVSEAHVDALEFPIYGALSDYKNDNNDDGIAKALANRESHGMSEEVVRSAVEKSVFYLLSYGDVDYAKKIIAAFQQPEEIFKTPRAKEEALKYISRKIKRIADSHQGEIISEYISDIAKICEISKDEIMSCAKKALLDELKAYHTPVSQGHIFVKIINEFGLQEYARRSPEIQDLARQALVKSMIKKSENEPLAADLGSALEFQELFGLPEVDEIFEPEKVHEFVQKAVRVHLRYGLKYEKEGGDNLERTVKKYSLSQEEVLSLAQEELISCLRDNDWKEALLIRDYFGSNGQELDKTIEEELNSNFSYPDHIKPILAAQGDSAELYFRAIKRMRNLQNLSLEDVDYITYVGKKYGTQARNILENILSEVDSIEGERALIEEYLGKVGVVHFNFYSEYKKAKDAGDAKGVETMKERITSLQDKIQKGEMEEKDFFDKMYKAVSYYTFPPAMGLTQDQYDRLIQDRPDRRADVPESLESLQYERFKVLTGRYVLGKEKELNLEEWAALSEAVKKVNQELEEKGGIKIDGENTGAKLIEIYRQKKQNSAEGRDSLFEEMYRYHLAHGGGKLESGYEISTEGLMKYKEFIGDRVKNDLIKDCLGEWREKHATEYEELKKETINRLKQSEHQNFSKVISISESIRKQKDEKKKEAAIAALDDFLADFGLSYEGIKDMDPSRLKIELGAITVEYEGKITKYDYRSEEYYNSPAFIKAYDELMGRYDQDALVIQKISSDLVAGINRKMKKEIDKFEFHGGTGGAEEHELELTISKKREHGVAGYNMGVCITPDEKLWNDPQFMNAIIFDPKLKQAMGGMHFLIRENCLCLPGINPSLDILSQVDNEKLFDKMIDYAKKVKEKLGLEKVLIPNSSTIHSNRTQIQEIIRKKAFKQHKLRKEAAFSYSPHAYSFQECFEVV